MTISVDRELCIDCGVCAKINPEIFILDEGAGIAQLLYEQCEQNESQKVNEAVLSCPVAYILTE